MPVVIREVSSSKDMRDFVYLPEQIHKDHSHWVPPFFAEDKKTFDPAKNLAHRYCDHVYALAYRDSSLVGRVAGIINHRYNEQWKKNDARFAYLECYEDKEVLSALLGHVQEWASKKGMHRVIGPQGFTEQDPEGFLIEGFEHPPNLSTYYNFEYLPRLLEAEGYTKEVDYVVYKVILANALSEFYKKVFERASRNTDFRLVEFSRRKELRTYIRPIFDLMNDCFKQIYGYSYLDDAEMDELARRYLPIIDPRFIKIVITNQNDLIGFVIGIPNMSDGIRRARGRLYPFGILKILKALKTSTKLDVYLGGVKEQYRGRGVDVLMGYRMLEMAIKAGFEYLDSNHELENNTKMRAEMERVGGKIYKRFRIYQKTL